MKRLRAKPWLPLLAKELVEQAARRRTYIVRVVYAVLLFGLFCMLAYRHFEAQGRGLSAFSGRGRPMFEALVVLQFLGIALFLPATMSGAITYEKERRSMALLLLTDLRPRHILAQKYLGRLVPILSFLLLGLPLLAICYAFGGVTSEYLAVGVYALALTCLQVGALALLCSAFCCTSLGALIAAYVLTAALYLGFPLLWLLFTSHRGPDDAAFVLVPLRLFFRTGDWFRRGCDLWDMMEAGLPILVSIAVCLVLARVFLVWRALLERRSRLLRVFRWLDRVFNRLNRMLGDIRLGREKESLPRDAPIAWREATRRSLGRPVYLMRILVLIEVPVLVLCASVVMEGAARGSAELLSAVFYVVAILAALAVSVTSANAIASERVSQTLDVLLTTPLRGRDIARQKLRGVRRLLAVALVPLATMLLVEAWWGGLRRYHYWRGYRDVAWQSAGLALLFAAVALVCFSWLSFWVGLRVKSRFRAITATLGVLLAWNVVPLIAYVLLEECFRYRTADFLLFFSPGAFLALLEQGELLSRHGRADEAADLIKLVFAGYAALTFVFWALCVWRADRYLGRAGGPAPSRAEGRRGSA